MPSVTSGNHCPDRTLPSLERASIPVVGSGYLFIRSDTVHSRSAASGSRA
jgi:hypothetical protein